MQAMGKKPKGEQQTYDFATMYTQLKLFAEDGADPNAPESREVLSSKMESYINLVFEHAKQTVKPHGMEKTLEVQQHGRSQQPWKQADANLEDTERIKFVTREKAHEVDYIHFKAVACASWGQHHEADCGNTDGHQLLPFPGKFNVVYV